MSLKMKKQIFQGYLNNYDKRTRQQVQLSVVPPKLTAGKTEVQAGPTDLPDNVEADIMESVPPTMKSRAQQLAMKENKNLVTWDDNPSSFTSLESTSLLFKDTST